MKRTARCMRSCLFVPVKSAILPTHNGQYFHTVADHTHCTSSAAHRFFTRFQHVALAPRDTSRTSPLGITRSWQTVRAERERTPRRRRGGDDERQTDAAATAAGRGGRNDAVNE